MNSVYVFSNPVDVVIDPATGVLFLPLIDEITILGHGLLDIEKFIRAKVLGRQIHIW